MTVKMSSGLMEAMLTSLKSATGETFNDAVLYLFGGSQPATANATEASNTLLCVISVDGGTFTPGSATNGLSFDVVSSNTTTMKSSMAKTASETWQGTAIADGTITWGRLYDNDRVQGASTSAIRLDGTASTVSTADFVLSTVNAVTGVDIVVTSFNLSFQSN